MNTTTSAMSASGTGPAEKFHTGTIISIDPDTQVLCLRSRMGLKKIFALGDSCTFFQLGNPNASMADLRAGERVTVRYVDALGVLVANRVEQEPMRLEGMVKAVDPGHHTLTLHRTALDKQLRLADDCQIHLRGGVAGGFGDIQPGNHVIVTYEIPGHEPVVHDIAQTSIEFVGTLTAIDLETRTLKARGLGQMKKFSVADHCAIVINDRMNGRLADLRLGDSLLFSYQTIAGVNVLDRIAPSPMETIARMAMLGPGPLGPPAGF